jgi:hypothetical protein
VQNNLFVRIELLPFPKSLGRENETDIAPAVRCLSESIGKSPLAADAAGLWKPRILAFRTVREGAKPDEAVELVLTTENPAGGKLKTQFLEGGALVYTEKGKRYIRAEKPGTYTVWVFAVNDRFLVGKRSLTFRVKD